MSGASAFLKHSITSNERSIYINSITLGLGVSFLIIRRLIIYKSFFKQKYSTLNIIAHEQIKDNAENIILAAVDLTGCIPSLLYSL